MLFFAAHVLALLAKPPALVLPKSYALYTGRPFHECPMKASHKSSTVCLDVACVFLLRPDLTLSQVLLLCQGYRAGAMCRPSSHIPQNIQRCLHR